MACPDPAEIAALAEGGGSPAGRTHLDSCPVCRAEVEALRTDLEAVPEDASLQLCREVARGVLSRRSLLPWAAAAAVLLSVSVWTLSWKAPPSIRPSASPAPSWLVEEGSPWTASRDAQPFLLEGGIPGAAWGGTRLRLAEGRLEVEGGEVLLRIPEGLGLSSLPSGEVWIGAQERSASLLRDARASETLRVWTPASKEAEPPRLRTLRAALPAPGTASGEGLVSVRLERPPREAEVLLAFPQPDGSRAWRLGDWESRGYPHVATFTVAYGPWGARGSVDGRRVWSLDARRVETALSRAPVASGMSVTGGGIRVLRSESWGAPE